MNHACPSGVSATSLISSNSFAQAIIVGGRFFKKARMVAGSSQSSE